MVDRCCAQLRGECIEKAHVFVLQTNVSGRQFWRDLGWTDRGDLNVLSSAVAHGAPDERLQTTRGLREFPPLVDS